MIEFIILQAIIWFATGYLVGRITLERKIAYLEGELSAIERALI